MAVQPEEVNVPQQASPAQAALGFRVKSGLAVAVLVVGPLRSPRAIDRRVIELCDPAVPASRQPYHAAMGTLQTDQAKVDKLRKVITRAADRSVSDLMRDYQKAGHDIRAAGLVVGSLIDPATITNSHIRAHALEGRLFRGVLEDALRSRGVSRRVVVEREVYARSAEALGRSEQELKHAVAQMGRELGGPWRADEKTAALAAWLALG
jgi:hypothetical protein